MGNKCIVCDAAAFAYRLTTGGGKSYLCDEHVPVEDISAGRIMADENRPRAKAKPRGFTASRKTPRDRREPMRPTA
jgi:hypothetical protein